MRSGFLQRILQQRSVSGGHLPAVQCTRKGRSNSSCQRLHGNCIELQQPSKLPVQRVWASEGAEIAVPPETVLLGCFLLEWLVIKCCQFLLNCQLQFFQGKKLLVSQRCQKPCGNHAHRAFLKCLVPRFWGSGRNNSSSVMFGHLLA